MTDYKHIDLFSGIGGFSLAARWAGFETVQFVEIDPFCRKVLNKNFPGVPIHDDIKTYKHSGASRPFLLTGGFPCQPFSCAGKRRGAEDDRALWPEMLRVISEARPTWVIGENVGGFISMGLDDCISDLEAEGYTVQPFVIPACAVNAPHRRDRVWIVALTPSTVQIEPSEDRFQKRTEYRESIGRHWVPGCLQEQISMLPTPKSQNANSPGEHGQGGKDLQTVVSLLPTPATRDYKGANGLNHMSKDRPHMDQLPNAITHGMNRGLKLQPGFVLWMCGYPEDWLDLRMESERTKSRW